MPDSFMDLILLSLGVGVILSLALLMLRGASSQPYFPDTVEGNRRLSDSIEALRVAEDSHSLSSSGKMELNELLCLQRERDEEARRLHATDLTG